MLKKCTVTVKPRARAGITTAHRRDGDLFAHRATSYTWTNLATMDLRFPGQWFQLESGLAYNWHRHYDATIGRYIEPDPLGLTAVLSDGPSVYGYVGGNPLAKVDPKGLQEICTKFFHPHSFLCVDGNCSGKYPSGNVIWSPGVIKNDTPNEPKAFCSKVPALSCSEDSFKKCIAKRIAQLGPSGDSYDFIGLNCGQWAEQVITQCRNECAQ